MLSVLVVLVVTLSFANCEPCLRLRLLGLEGVDPFISFLAMDEDWHY